MPDNAPSSIKALFIFMAKRFDYQDRQAKSLKDSIPSLDIIKKSIETEFIKRDSKIERIESDTSLLLDRVAQLEIQSNKAEQRQRDLSLRFTNVSLPQKVSNWECSTVLYNSFFKPAFQSAVNDGILESIPAMHTVVEFAHPLHKIPGKIPVIICKLTTRNLKMIFHKKKGEVLKKYEVDNKVKSKCYDDLTSTNLRCLALLYGDSLIERAWCTGGIIKFSLKASPLVTNTVSARSTLR